MRRPANSPWRATSVNHRRRAGCSSARGRRRKWRICRRPWSSTGSRASATHHASASQRAKTKVRCTTALFRIHCALHSWAHTERSFSVYRSEHVWWQLPVWCSGLGWWWVGRTVLHISAENYHHPLTNMQNRTREYPDSPASRLLFSTDVDSSSPLSPPVLGTSYSDPFHLSAKTPQSSLQSSSQLSVEYERSPIQNSPWKESSLDQPFQKPTKPQSACSSRSRYEPGLFDTLPHWVSFISVKEITRIDIHKVQISLRKTKT